jgi:hypothetical protein
MVAGDAVPGKQIFAAKRILSIKFAKIIFTDIPIIGIFKF